MKLYLAMMNKVASFIYPYMDKDTANLNMTAATITINSILFLLVVGAIQTLVGIFH